jgi:hypothetical protein
MCSSETSVNFHRTTRRYVPEYGTLHNHCCENLKSRKRREAIVALVLDDRIVYIHLLIHRRFKRIQIFVVSMGEKYQDII